MKNLRYAILWHHDIASPHFDLMFETSSGSELATWRSPVWPIVGPTELLRLKDHRQIYLQFEGDLSGDRGRVERVVSGMCEMNEDAGNWIIRLADGDRIQTLIFKQIAGDRWQAVTQ